MNYLALLDPKAELPDGFEIVITDFHITHSGSEYLQRFALSWDDFIVRAVNLGYQIDESRDELNRAIVFRFKRKNLD